MAVSVTSDLTSVTTADATTAQGTWARVNGTSSGNPAVEADGKVQGAACLVAKCGATVAPTDVGLSVPLTATFNATGKHIFSWRNNTTAANMSTKANAGTSLHLSTAATFGTTNYKRWYLDGSDTEIIGGWKCYVIDPSSAGNISAGTLDLTVIKTLGFLHRQITGVTTSLNNMQVDIVYVGTGLTGSASSSADTITFNNLYTTDSLNTNAWGIITQNAGIYYGAGKLTVGSASQSNTCLFKDTNQVLVWRDYPVSNTLYDFNLLGNTGQLTTFQLGNKDGSGNTSEGCVIRGQGAAVWNITCGSNTGFKAYASSLANIRAATLSSTSEIKDTAVSSSGTIDVNGAIITGCSFSSHTATQLKIDSSAEASSVSSSTFTTAGTGHAIEITTPGSYTFSSLTFNGYGTTGTTNAAVYNNSGGAVTITVSGGNSPTYRNGTSATTSVISGATVTFTGLPTGTDIVILTAGTNTILQQVDANAGSSYAWGYSGTPTVDVGFIKTGYKVRYIRNLPLGSADASIPVELQLDLNFVQE